MFINQNSAKTNGFELHKLETPLRAYNVDGTENKQGKIKTYINLDLKINGRRITTKLLVTGLGKERFPWLNEENPSINWQTGDFSWRRKKNEDFSSTTIK